MRKPILLFCQLALCAFVFAQQPERPPAAAPPGGPERFLVGAHFYAWYNRGSWNTVDAEPMLGHYVSSTARIVDRQISYAANYGVSFFGYEWSGPGNGADRTLANVFLNSPELSRISFCIDYDTTTRFHDIMKPPIDFDNPVIFAKFVNDFDYLSRNYFGHPKYLKFHGRPVVWLYLARGIRGNWKTALERARQKVRENGYDLYVDGDLLRPEGIDTSRFEWFDAASAYLINDRRLFERRGVRFTGDVVPIMRQQYEDWSREVPLARNRWTHLPLAFHPVITPQFHKPEMPDAVRYRLRSPDEFRQQALLARAAATYDSEARAKIVWVTSWNEWYEHSAVEPTAAGVSPEKNYGFQLLDVIHDVFGDDAGR